MDFPPRHAGPPPSIPTPGPRPEAVEPSAPRRLFLFEPGWNVGLKVGSERVFCYMMAPGQDYYHRIADGELYLHHNEERLCFACAERRGLLSHEPRSLREPIAGFDVVVDPNTPPLRIQGEDDSADDEPID